jgi:UDP-N-acetylmuramoylalanine--D-glutamate ligase
MKIEELRGKKITIMGLGLLGGGLGTVRFLHSVGAKIIVTDIKSKEELASSLEKLKDLKNIEYVLGQHRAEDFTKVDMVIKNPAASWENKYIKMALEKNIPVEIDSSLFFKLCPNTIIGVTGTKGKTTTCALIYDILKEAGKMPVKIGVDKISVIDKLKDLKKESIVVFELSSWRLSALGRYGLSPQIAVVTNIYPDHLNYYKTMEDYINDKKYIFSNQKPSGLCIINGDDEILKKNISAIKAQVIKFSQEKVKHGRGVYISEGNIYVNNGIDEKKVTEISSIKLKGKHNLENILAGIAATYFLGIGLEQIKKAVLKFEKAPAQRLEFVGEFEGIKYYNDTAATTPESAIRGLNSFEEPVILICGGADKNLNMADFAKAICAQVKGVIFLKGEASNKIMAEMRKLGLSDNEEKDFVIVESMKKALEVAKAVAEKGDVILLSPGAASFGLFANEFDRGDKFVEEVKRLTI